MEQSSNSRRATQIIEAKFDPRLKTYTLVGVSGQACHYRGGSGCFIAGFGFASNTYCLTAGDTIRTCVTV